MTNDAYIMEINRRISLGKTSMANLTKLVKDSEFVTNIKDNQCRQQYSMDAKAGR
jgi:hypothetical protein